VFSLKSFLLLAIILVIILSIEQITPRVVIESGAFRYLSVPKLIFISLTIVSFVIQYFIIGYISKLYVRKDKHWISILVIQSIITILMIIIILNIVQNYRYSAHNIYQIVGAVSSISYVTAIVFFGLSAYKFLKFYGINLNITSLLYGFAFCALAVNAIVQSISLTMHLGNILIMPSCYGLENPQICFYIWLSSQVTWIISFFILWAASIFLLYRSKTLVGTKFWIIVSIPVILLSQFIFPRVALSLIDLVGIDMLIFIILSLYFGAKLVTAFAFGTCVWTSRKIIPDISKKDLVIIAGMGLFLYILSINQTIYLPFEGFHPLSGVPFGAVTLSLVGLFAYMISINPIGHLLLNRK